jgi:endonuclease-3
MATQSKTQLLTEVHTLLKKRYKPKSDRNNGRLSVLEAVIYGVCHEGSTREQANQALSRFKDGFFDWNEVRVSTIEEIQGALAGLGGTEDRAQRIRRFLRQLFERTYGFSLETLTKKTLKDAVKSLQEYEAFASDYVLATVIQHALGGHAIPVDEPTRRALKRLGIVDDSTDNAALRSLLERAVPKNRGCEFIDLIEELAHDTCVEGVPDCPRCELRKVCHTGLARQEQARAATSAAKSTRSKSAAPAPAPAPAKAGGKGHDGPVKPAAAKRKPGGKK